MVNSLCLFGYLLIFIQLEMKKILVIGAARSGIAATKLLLKNGYNVILTDTKNKEEILNNFPELNDLEENHSKSLELILGEQVNPDVLDEIDTIVISPGIPETIPIIVEADKRNLPVLSELEIAYELSHTPFLAITGTNGKTTTTTLTGEIFEEADLNTYVVGNIGEAISNYVTKANEDSVFIAEVGSFQLDRTKDFKPKGAVILNITPDHLDRHKTMENYINAKAKIFANQNDDDYLILNIDDPIVKKLTDNQDVNHYWLSTEGKVDNGAYYENGVLYLNVNGEALQILNKDELGIKGIHNIQNALAAALLAYLYGIDLEVIQKVLKEFKGVEHRQEFVTQKDGVRYINDSKGTNTDASIIALNAMETPTILIAGGYDKKEDYDKFSKKIKEVAKEVILLGQTKEDIKKSLEENGYNDYKLVDSFEEAVELAMEDAVVGDTVLLSPACASWDMFDNYETRGKLFKKLVLEK